MSSPRQGNGDRTEQQPKGDTETERDEIDFGDATRSGFAFDALGQLWVVRTTIADNRFRADREPLMWPRPGTLSNAITGPTDRL